MMLQSLSVSTIAIVTFGTVALISMGQPVLAGLRDSFTKIGDEQREQMKIDDPGFTSSGLSREMWLMRDKQWELHPADFSGIKERRLRSHCEKYLGGKSVKVELTKRPTTFGLKAIGKVYDGGSTTGKALKGCRWRQRNGEDIRGSELLKMPYDEAVQKAFPTIEFEVQLPPLKKAAGEKGSKKRKRVSVIYSVAVDSGSMNLKAIVPRGSCSVKVLPNGRGENGGGEVVTLPGKSYVSIPQGPGIVDRGWAKGSVVFRRGRPTGTV